MVGVNLVEDMVAAIPAGLYDELLFDEAGLEMEAVKRDEERTIYLCRKGEARP